MYAIYILIAIIVAGSLISAAVRRAAAKKAADEKQRLIAARQKAADENGGGMTSPLKAAEFKPVQRPKVTPHTHPKAAGAAKVEQVFTEEGMGGPITEGCVEHYKERVILMPSEKNIPESKAELAELIVLGEVLGTPRAKTLKLRAK